MRKALFALALILPAQVSQAWEFTPGLPCLLTHEFGSVSVELTYDPTAPLYTISVTQAAPFTPAPIFSIRFVGKAPLTISTDRHRFSNDGRTLTVQDRGFGNVLNGLQFNEVAAAMLGAQVIPIPLDGAAGPVAAFRDCTVEALS